MSSLTQIRRALRGLAKAPSFTAVAILTLAIGIGACTAIYTVVHSVLLAPLPYPEPDRLVHLWQINAQGGRVAFSDPNYEDVRAHTRSFHALTQYSGADEVVATDMSSTRARIAVISRELSEVLRIQPAVGRWFVADEQQPGGRLAAIVSYAFWMQHLGGDSDLSRRTLTYQGGTFAIVGVMPLGARFPTFRADVYVPRELRRPLPSRTAHNWRVIGRLRDGVSIEQARMDLRAIAADLKRQHGDGTRMSDVAVVPLHEQIVGESRRSLLVMLAAAAFLLLLACANVVNLLLMRATGRQRESAVCAALGASRATLFLPFITESFLLAACGAGLGLLISSAAIDGWLLLDPQGLPRVEDVRLSWSVLGFAIGVTSATAIVMGMLAGWQASRRVSVDHLRAGWKTSGVKGSGYVRSALVVTQIGVSVVLLTGAGLITRTVRQLLDQDPGFRLERLVALDLVTPRVNPFITSGSPSEDESALADRANFHQAVLARLRSLPGVVAAGGVNAFPMSGGGADGQFLILAPAVDRWVSEILARCGRRPFASDCAAEVSDQWGRFRGDETTGSAEFRVASEDYFRAMGIPLLRGRLFKERDSPTAPHVAVISESLAKSRWPGQDPIGRRIEYGNMDGDFTPLTIVGIVGDVREQGLGATPRPTVYGYYRQRPAVTARFTIAVHSTVEPAWLMRQTRGIVRELDPRVPIELRTIEQLVAASMVDRRIMLMLLACFAGAALLITAIGLYGVISYGVVQRIRELGVRLALGAQPRDVRWLVLLQGLRLTFAGVAVGLILAFASTRALSSLLFGVLPNDPVTYTGVSLLLAGVAAIACYIPARRAARVEPLVALRYE